MPRSTDSLGDIIAGPLSDYISSNNTAWISIKYLQHLLRRILGMWPFQSFQTKEMKEVHCYISSSQLGHTLSSVNLPYTPRYFVLTAGPADFSHAAYIVRMYLYNKMLSTCVNSLNACCNSVGLYFHMKDMHL